LGDTDTNKKKKATENKINPEEKTISRWQQEISSTNDDGSKLSLGEIKQQLMGKKE